MATDVRLAAYMGDPDAAAQLGDARPKVPEKLLAWTWGLSAWGKPALVGAAVRLARLALPVWLEFREPSHGLAGRGKNGKLYVETYSTIKFRLAFRQARLARLVELAEEWLADPQEEQRQCVRAAAQEAANRVISIDHHAQELSGGLVLTKARERAVFAGL